MIDPTEEVPRWAERRVREALLDTPVVVIQGARQVGKSTLALKIADTAGGRLLSLDDRDVLAAAQADPDGFVRQGPGQLLGLDEVQRLPGVLTAVKAAVDANRRPGSFLLTGSADLLSIAGSPESLAGRAETVPLFGFSQGELHGVREDFVGQIVENRAQLSFDLTDPPSRAEYAELLEAGGYPEPQHRSATRRRRWFVDYLARVVEHDAGEVSRLRQVDRLDRLLRLVAANTAGELNRARVARDSGIPETSVEPYLRLLETLYLSRRLPAWGNNLTQRVVGRPKVVVSDSGLATRLLGLDAKLLAEPTAGERFGQLLETFAVNELGKQQSWSDVDYDLFHFRDRRGYEVDVVVELSDGRVIGIEIKAARSISGTDLGGLRLLRNKLGRRFMAGFVLNTSDRLLRLDDRLWSAPVAALWSSSSSG